MRSVRVENSWANPSALFELRKSGEIKFQHSKKKLLASLALENEAHVVGKELYEQAKERWERHLKSYEREVQDWVERAGLQSWFRRLFGTRPRQKPDEPNPLYYNEVALRRLPAASNLSDSLIDYAATFTLPPFPTQAEDILKEHVFLLAGQP